MSIQIQLRRGIASDWTSANPILAYGEMGLETDTYKFKWGDGVTDWVSLSYFGTTAGFITGAGAAGQVSVFDATSNITSYASFLFSGSVLTLGAVSLGTGEIDLKGTTSGTVTFKAQDSAGTWALVLPVAGGTANQLFGQSSGGVNSEWKSLVNSDITWGYSPGTITPTIANDAVTFAKFQNITTNRLLGRATAGSGDMEEITLGTGLSYAATTLNVSGFASSTLANNHIFVGNGSNVATDVAMSGDATIVASGALTLASVISAGGPTGSATVAPIITWDAKGRLTAVSSATITPAASSITGGAALTKTDDTNVTATLGGSPTTALLAATSITLGWTGTLSGTRGGTGVNNGSNTITLAGNLVTSGAFSLTLTTTATTNVTLPTTGTLSTLAGTETLTNKKLVDNSVTFVDNGDATKQLAFELSGITTATTRTVTAVNWSGTDVLSNGALTSGRVPFSGATGLEDDADLTFATDTLTCTIYAVTTRIEPVANDGAPLGSTTKQFSDLFLAEGGVINWDNGDATLTQVGDVVTLAGADLKVTTPGNVSTSVLTTDGTQTVTNKTIGVTQLNSGAYTFPANNTSGTANHTAITFRDTGITSYGETISWTGTTAPSGTLTANYAWQQTAGLVFLTISFNYATAGTANTAVSCPLPTGAPAPNEWTTWGAAGEKLYGGFGYVDSVATGAPNAARVYLLVNGTDTGYNLNATLGSSNAKVGVLTVIYRT